MSIEANKAVLVAHVQAMNEQRLESLDDHPGIAHTKPFFQQYFAAFPDSTSTLHEVVAEGDWVAYRLMLRGTHQGEWLGIPATGRRVEYEALGMMKIVDGKIVEDHGQADNITLMQQLGALPASVGD